MDCRIVEQGSRTGLEEMTRNLLSTGQSDLYYSVDMCTFVVYNKDNNYSSILMSIS